MTTTVHVIRTGVANLASVLAALERLGARVELTDDADLVHQAERLVLPGVGAFAAGAARLEQAGLVGPLRQRLAQNTHPTLAICLGLQLLGTASEESPGARGLGAVDARATRFTGPVRVPQLGWNLVRPQPDCRLLEEGHAYFANSFKFDALPPGCTGALADHGGPFVAAIERGPLLACQFHPELSGAWGQVLLARWLAL